MKCFEAHPAKEWKGQPWVFAGDDEHVKRARLLFSEKLNSKGTGPHQAEQFKLDWEPFEVIRDMLEEAQNDHSKYSFGSIGGAPQVMKIYEYLSSQMLGVKWKNKGDETIKTYISGRQALDYEVPDAWILDPQTLLTSHPRFSENIDLPDVEPAEEYTESEIMP